LTVTPDEVDEGGQILVEAISAASG
jgi:hypothetical protein